MNGDDFGRSDSLTQGIVEAHQRGILTSTSIVANSQAFERAVQAARDEPTLGVGVHLVLDEYPSRLPREEIATLVDEHGRFYPRFTGFLRVQSGRAWGTHLAREWDSQIQKVVDAGIEPTHLDGHGHCHMLPAAASIIVELAKKHGIRAARLPAEQMSLLSSVTPRYLMRYILNIGLRAACSRTKARWRSELICPDAFFGFADGGRLTARSIGHILARVQPGVSELMAHPGMLAHDPVLPIAYDWAGDLSALTTYSREAITSAFNVEFASYKDAWD